MLLNMSINPEWFPGGIAEGPIISIGLTGLAMRRFSSNTTREEAEVDREGSNLIYTTNDAHISCFLLPLFISTLTPLLLLLADSYVLHQTILFVSGLV